MNKILKWTLIIFAVFVFFGVLEQSFDHQTKSVEQQQEPVSTIVQQTSGPVKEIPEDDPVKEDASKRQYSIPEQPSSLEYPRSDNLTVHFIDVGQGDSILVEYDGKSMLVDAGESNMGSRVSAFLMELGISSLDYVVATHPHADHIGGLLTIIDQYPVGQFIDSGYPHTSQTYENMLIAIDTKDIPFHVVQRGESIDLAQGIDIQVLNPGKERSNDINENSVVLKITDGDVSFLLMGDAGLETESSIMAAGYDVDADILKVGHHASISGSGQNFIKAVSPEISIIEVGADNNYGHPHAEILQRLQSMSTVYRTDLDGTITITTDGSAYTVTTRNTGYNKTRAQSEVTTNDPMTISASDNTIAAPAETSTPDEGIKISDLSLKEEFVMIKNLGSSSVDLTGWQIKDEGDKHTYTFPSFRLEAGATVTLYTADGPNTETELFWGSGKPIWNNDGDTAFLYDNEGYLIDSLKRRT
ncbi:lamin tail domain-containing protein [Methanomethylovorans sp.]|uniref:lamin tail domain-containing protein n=1 Tax=Methanomethylovorans sp. TaxID=2758717 RepID=UPI00345EFBD6